MTDMVVADLESPTSGSSGPARTVPLLSVTIALLLATAVAAALLGVGRDDERPAEERLAAASDAATEEDFAFEVTVASSSTRNAEFRLLGAFDAETTRVRAISEGLGAGIDFVIDGTTQYIKIPPNAGSVGGTTGKPWLKMDLSALVGENRPGSASSNPLDTFRQLDAITGPIVRVGEEEVRGEPTVHFRTTIDATKTLPPGRTVPNIELLQNVPVDVWLDEQDRPRRYRQSIDVPVGGKAQTITTTVESFDFGKSVSVDLPPLDQVGDFDISALLPAPAPAG